MKISLNGRIVAAEDARIAPDDRGFTLGDGLFETIAVRRGAPRRLPAHLARLRAGAGVLDLPIPFDDARLAALIGALIDANGLAGKDAALRLTLSRGPGVRGLAPPPAAQPTCVVTSGPLPPQTPVALIVAAGTRRNEHSPLARIKSLNFLDNILARQEAAAARADDAVLLNTVGRVAEATAANIFLLIDGGLVTPPVAEGALPGVMRAEVIRLARAAEQPLAPADLARASEAFLSTALGIRPVTRIDGRPVGDGAAGLITQLLAARL